MAQSANAPTLADLMYQFYSGLPPGNTVLTGASGNVAATATTATLAATVGKTNYITGFDITGAGATAASVVLVTVTGVVGGPLTFPLTVPAGAAVALTPLQVRFPFPIPATGTNVAIVVNVPSFGAGNTNAAVVAYGFQL